MSRKPTKPTTSKPKAKLTTNHNQIDEVPPRPDKKHRRRPKESDWTIPFLEKLSQYPCVILACRAANVSAPVAYKRRREDEEFRRAWRDAKRLSIERLERTMFKRAHEGSDTLAMFMMRAHGGEKYKKVEREDRQHLAASNVSININIPANSRDDIPIEAVVNEVPVSMVSVNGEATSCQE